jgi:type II secretory pathway component GspD/PulD (secretin)/tetratricopeptide (TPR) repeat protein
MVGIVGALTVVLCGNPGIPQAHGHPWSPSPDARQSAQDRGEAALAAAREAESAGRWREAADRYAEALNFLPDSTEAAEGLRRAQVMLNEATTSEDVGQIRKQLHDQAVVEFDADYDRAEELLRENDFSGAQQAMIAGRVKLEQRRDVLSPGEFDDRLRRAEQMLARIDEARIKDEAAKALAQQKELTERQIEEERRQAELRQQQIDDGLRRVRQLQMELKYREALQVIDEVLFIDPLNPSALALRDVIRSAMLYREYGQYIYDSEYFITQQALANQKAMVIPGPNMSGPGPRSLSGIMQYPEDWPQVSLRRTGDVGGYAESPADRAVYQVLRDTRVPVDFTNNTFEQVIDYLKSVTGLKIYVDWKALNLVGIGKEDEITLQLGEVSVSTALDRIMDQLGEGADRPQYAVENGILTISSDEAIRQRTMLVVYDIRDLIFQVPVFDNAPTLDLDAALQQGQQGGGGGGGGGGGFGGGGGGGGGGGAGGGGAIIGEPGAEGERLTRAELVRQIVDIIQENVDPEGWRDLGGDTGSLQELNGNLIITNTPNNHREIVGLLSQLREIRAIQINVESRFLTVSTDWFEKIGVDLDLYFNTNSSVFSQARAVDSNAHLSDFFDASGRLKDPLVYGSPAQVGTSTVAGTPPFNAFPSGAFFGSPDGTATGGFANIGYATGQDLPGAPIRTTDGFAPIGVTQRSITLVDQLADFAGDSFAGVALANPALAVGIQFLDDVQVDLLIEATQADKRSVVLTAPRLTFFNGQRAWIAVTTQRSFVSALTAVTGDASGAFQPTISTLSDGFVLDVEGVISSDRRYVTMTVIFDFAEFLGFRESSAADFGGAAGGGGTGGGNAAQFTGRVELPILRGSRLRTTVSVPDKGTVLLGGQRSVNEVEVEAGVPILSKIPFINRFFTNRISSKTEQTLLILIRPEIIIQQENEDLLFPGLGDSLGAGASYLR